MHRELLVERGTQLLVARLPDQLLQLRRLLQQLDIVTPGRQLALALRGGHGLPKRLCAIQCLTHAATGVSSRKMRK